MNIALQAELDEEARVAAKVYRRLMWFLMLLFICSYLDRVNVNYAALRMNADLGITSTMFGIANSAFYIAYLLAEIPSNMLLARFGARLWIPRIMITWGIASAATMFATGPHSLYSLRALVGLAEAGFLPGVLLYMTYWFPQSFRGRAASMLIIAQPITQAFGASLSGVILDLAGWRWLFVIEGIPSILLGVIAYRVLRDRPADARWLNDSEKRALKRAIDRGASAQNPAALRVGGIVRELFTAPVLLLSVVYFGLVSTLTANSTWVPQIIRAVLPHGSFTMVGLVNAIPPLVTILLMPWWAARSDRRHERTWHLALPMLLAATGWVMVIFLAEPGLRLLGMVLCSAGTFGAQSIFWTLPALYLSAKARPVGIAFVNAVGLLGSAVGPYVVGRLRDLTGSFTGGLLFVVAMILLGVICAFATPMAARRRSAAIVSI